MISYKRIFIAACLCCSIIVITVYNKLNEIPELYYLTFTKPEDMKYIVNNSKCKILDLNPFYSEVDNFHKPEKFLPCRKFGLLTYITKKENIATLHINKSLLPLYSENKLECFYAYITRPTDLTKENVDSTYDLSPETLFNGSVALKEDFVDVKCIDFKNHKLVYENTHATVTVKPSLEKNVQNRSLSVLIIGIDSVSRLNFIRNMPQTHKFLENWISLKGYNKVGDNTFPNIMAILTGYSEYGVYSECNPRHRGGLDRCPFLWKSFKRFGYVTACAEDESWISTFNHEKKGFTETPTDYYFRPYILRTEKLKSLWLEENKYCAGPETTGERLLNIIKDFTTTFKNKSSFGIFWMNSFSHNSLNLVSKMDGQMKQFFEALTNEGILDNTMIVFLSDHGLRCGGFRNTAMGWLEERLPFIYMWIPKLFRQKFPEKYSNLKNNVNKLTSPFDLFLTLQEIIQINKISEGCPNCQSLFTEIPPERSCKEAGIPQHWCSCMDFISKNDIDENVLEKAVQYFIQRINAFIHSRIGGEKCARFSLGKVLRVGVSKSHKGQTFLLLVIETKPKGWFETTLAYYHYESKLGYFKIKGGISRIDRYAPNSECIEDPDLRMYCYCTDHNNNNIKGTLNRMDMFNFLLLSQLNH